MSHSRVLHEKKKEFCMEINGISDTFNHDLQEKVDRIIRAIS